MAAQPTQSFPFLGSDNQTYTGWTIPLDANGNLTISASALPLATGAATSALQSTANTSLAAIQTAVSGATPAGTNVIGKVGIDQTTPGTTNKVSIGTDGSVAVTTLPALVAGTAVVGKFGIDQTTPGTTNKVSIGTDGSVVVTSLPATAATLAAQTTGNQSLAQIVTNTATQPALVAGTAIIGKVGIDQTTPGTTNKVSIGTDGSVTVSNFASSGLATSAKQPALGTAGTPSADVITVQGVTNGIALKVDASGTTQASQIVDSAGTVKATIKPASTGATATDTALVVAISPNSVNANGQGTMAASAPVVIASDQSALAIKGSGSVAKASSVSVTLASDQGSLVITGDVAVGAADTVAPLKVGGTAQINAYPTAATASGQRVAALFDKVGKQVTVGALRGLKSKQFTTLATASSDTVIVTATAGYFNDLYKLTITNPTSSVATVNIKDNSTIVDSFIVQPTSSTGFTLPVDSAVVQTTVNTAWSANSNVAGVTISAATVANV